MGKGRYWAVLFLLLGLCLYAVNRDLWVYENDRPCKRTFTAAENVKGDYVLTDGIVLKPGCYQLALAGTVIGVGSGVVLLDGDDGVFYASDFPVEVEGEALFDFEVTESVKQTRVVLRYDPASDVRLERVRIHANHVLYTESLTRHAVLSLFIVLLFLWMGRRLIGKPHPITEREKVFILLAGLTALTCFPFFNPGTYIHGEDTFFHLSRIEGIAQSLKAGYFPARNQLYWLQNYGYGCGFFYPDLLLYIPAVLRLLGFSLLTVNKLFLTLCVFFSLLTVWLCARNLTDSRKAALAAVMFQSFAAFPLIDLYYRGTVGETQALIFIPLVIWGLRDLITGKPKAWRVFALGFFGLLCTHMIMTAVCAVGTALTLLICARRVVTNRQVLAGLVKSVCLVLCAGAFFWIPMLEQTLMTPGLRINTILSSRVHGIQPIAVMPWRNMGMFFHAWDSAYQQRAVYPGLSFGLLILLRLALLLRGRRVPLADGLGLGGLFLLWACTDLFPWARLIWFLNRIQFAWRLLLPASVLLSLCGGMYFDGLLQSIGITGRKGRCVPFIALGLFCFFVSAGPILREAVEVRSVPKDRFVMQNNRISGSEYMPVNLSAEFVDKNRDTVLLNGVEYSALSHKRSGLSFRFAYDLAEQRDGIVETGSGVRFSLPLIYYCGYVANLTLDDGTVIPLDVIPDEKGLVSVDVRDFPSGQVRAAYEKTLVQWVSEVLSLLTIFTVMGFVWFERRRNG